MPENASIQQQRHLIHQVYQVFSTHDSQQSSNENKLVHARDGIEQEYNRDLIKWGTDAANPSFIGLLWRWGSIAAGAGAFILLLGFVILLLSVIRGAYWLLLIPCIAGIATYFVLVTKRNTYLASIRDAKLAQAQANFEAEQRRIEQIFRQNIEALKQEIEAFNRTFTNGGELVFSAMRWNDREWAKWKPVTTSTRTTRIGELTIPPQRYFPTMPAFVTPLGGKNLLFKTSAEGMQSAKNTVKSLLSRLLATQPPGKVLFTFIDAETIGQNAAPFMPLTDHNPELVTTKIWVESNDIEQQLRLLTEQIEYVNRMYLRGGYTSIEEYNRAANEVMEPYRVLVVWDFPAKFTKEATERLINIAVNGTRCGVSTIVIYDIDAPLPDGLDIIDDWVTGQITGNLTSRRLTTRQLTENLSTIQLAAGQSVNGEQGVPIGRFDKWESVADVFEWNGNHFRWHDSDFGNLPLAFDSSPSLPLFNQMLEQVGEASKSTTGVRLPFERIALPRNQWWQGNSSEGISVPIGRPFARRADGAKPLVFSLDYDQPAQHAFVGGTTGSGKSILLRELIANLALKYGPDEIKLYIIDLKDVSFLPFVNHTLPHIRTIAINSDPEYVLSVLKEIEREFENRKKLFKQVGLQQHLNIEKIAQYRRAMPSDKLPRILLIVDELQELFAKEGEIADRALTLLTKFAKGGRSFGIHVILASQTLAGESMRRVEREFVHQVGLRIAMKCTEDDSRRILGADNPAAKSLTGKGHGIYNTELGVQSGNVEFQGAMFAEEDSKYLEAVCQLAVERNYTSKEKQLIFNGYEPASVADNDLLTNIVFGPTWQAAGNDTTIWLGDPIDITTQTAILLKRESRCNLLLLGLHQDYASGILITSLITLAALHAPSTACFSVLDFSGDNAFRNLLARDVGQLAPHKIRVVKRSDASTVIAEIHAEISKRDDGEEQSATTYPRIYLFIYGLPRERELNQEMPDESGTTLAERLYTVIQEGPQLGIHTLMWCDRLAYLKDRLGSWALDAFDKKALFQMSGEDIRDIVGERIASPEQDRALFHSDDEGRLEKFRPYPVPSSDWLRQAVEAIVHKNVE